VAYFSKDFVKFFKELENNNNREWFTENKPRYEKNIKEPFFNLVGELLTRISFDDPLTLSDPKECIFRIYRDIRFSKDKTPYKTYCSALVSHGGRKALNDPGFYFELNHKGINVYTGLYNVDKEGLAKIRSKIAGNIKEFNKVILNKRFVEKFGNEILGTKSKRLPPDLTEAAIVQPLIYNMQFYSRAELNKSLIMSDELSDILFDYYNAGVPLTQYLENALHNS
jgi:uncharacterized protein (TIGR02453 family)